MRRWVLRIVLFLLLGAIVNVAVAWAAAIYSPSTENVKAIERSLAWRDDVVEWWAGNVPFAETSLPIDAYPDAYIRDRYELSVGDSFWTIRAPGIEIVHATGTIDGLRFPGASDSRDAPSLIEGSVEVTRVQTGWPKRAFLAARWKSQPDRTAAGDSVVWGWPVDAPDLNYVNAEFTFLMGGRLLPLRPIWPGFAINTVFYAVVLWLLFAGPFVVRPWRRICRGLCPKCAYDLRGTPESGACPECGASERLSRR